MKTNTWNQKIKTQKITKWSINPNGQLKKKPQDC